MFEIAVKHTEPEVVAFIDMHGPYAQIPSSYDRLYHWLEHEGIRSVGMPHAVYFTDPGVIPQDEALWELQAPVAGEHADREPDRQGIGIKHLDSELVAFVLHRGPYDAMGPAYHQLVDWIATNGYEVCGPPEELYLSDPEETAPADYLTEIRFPVLRRG